MPALTFAGAHTALVTPFKDGKLDEASLSALIEAQIQGGISGIVPVGTTGESPTLTHEEHRRVIEIAVKVADKRVLVIAGTGSNATSEAVELTIEAERLGADAALVVAPYYNKPSAEGLYRHFKKIAKAVKKMFRLHGPLVSGHDSSSLLQGVAQISAGPIADRYRASFTCKSV